MTSFVPQLLVKKTMTEIITNTPTTPPPVHCSATSERWRLIYVCSSKKVTWETQFSRCQDPTEPASLQHPRCDEAEEIFGIADRVVDDGWCNVVPSTMLRNKSGMLMFLIVVFMNSHARLGTAALKHQHRNTSLSRACNGRSVMCALRSRRGGSRFASVVIWDKPFMNPHLSDAAFPKAQCPQFVLLPWFSTTSVACLLASLLHMCLQLLRCFSGRLPVGPD